MKALVCLLIFTLVNCSDNDDSFDMIDDPAIEGIAGTWRVVSFEDHKSRIVLHKTDENSCNEDVIVVFDDLSSPPSYTGVNTTNGISGEYEYPGGRELQVLRMASTFAGQPQWGAWFGEALTNAESFKVNHRNLRIYYNSGMKSVTFVRQ
jgi:hypothetical protein